MRSKPVAFLLSDLGVTKTHSRPYTSTDNPYSEAHFKTLKYRPAFPARFDSNRASARVLPRVLRLGQPRPPPLRDRPDDPGDRPLQTRHAGARRPAARPRRRLPGDARPVPPLGTDSATGPNRRVDQQAHDDRGGRSLNTETKCLTGLDRLRRLAEPPTHAHPGARQL